MYKKISLIFIFLDELIFDNIFFHNIFLFLTKRKTLKNYISKDQKYFITGFPRSGNTFLTRLFKSLFPDIRISSHIHTISAIKYSKKIGLKIFVVHRNIDESISSLILKRFSRFEESRILIYLLKQRHKRFYKFCRNQNLEIINFEELTTNTTEVLKKISKILGREIPEGIEFFIKNTQKSIYIDKRDKLSATFPNKDKETKKSFLKKLIQEV